MRHDPALSGASAAPLPSRDAILKEHRGAHELAVYDGRTRIGTVVADDDNWRTAKCWAFDAADVPIGAFRNRREAMAAVAPGGRTC